MQFNINHKLLNNDSGVYIVHFDHFLRGWIRINCRFCSQILCKYKCTHLAMKLHRRFIFFFSIYMCSLTSLVSLAKNPDAHCRFCSKTCKCRVRIQMHIIGNEIPPISVGCTEIAPFSFLPKWF